jgi:hypothetical protein
MNKLLERYYVARKNHDDILEELDNEVERIVKIIMKAFKCKNSWWAYKYYHDADDDTPLP